MKYLTTQVLDQIYEDRFIACDILEIHLRNQAGTSIPLYLTNGHFDVAYDSPTAPTSGVNTYLAQGQFLALSNVTEEIDVRVGKFSITLSAINNDYLNLFTANEVEGKRVVLYKTFLEYNTLEVIPYPIMLFDGIIMNTIITETPGTVTLNLDCSTLFSDFERTNGRMTNSTSNWLYQGVKYDKCFEKSGWVGNSEIAWGRTK